MAQRKNSLEIIYLPIDQIKPYERELRKHSKEQIAKAEKLIGHFGQATPLIVDRDFVIVDGHLIWTVLKSKGYDEVAVTISPSRDEADIKALRLALNRLPEDSEWNKPEVAAEFRALYEYNFDLEFTAFDDVQIEGYLTIGEEPLEPEDNPFDTLLDETKTVCQKGDLWKLGDHLLLCGNALEEDDFFKLMGDDRARLVLSDPPYNVSVKDHVGGLGEVQHDEFAMASGEMSEAEFIEFLTTMAKNCAAYSVDGSLHVYFMDWRHNWEVLSMGRNVYDEYKALCLWAKTNSGMGSLYRSQHECAHFFKKGKAKHINNVQLGVHGRNRTNVWTYPGVNTFKKDRMEELENHPTPKPVQMIADCILDVSNKRDIVLDCFAGGGSLIIAAERTGRVARCIEFEPKFCDVIIRRWQNETGCDALLVSSGKTFAEME